MSGYQGSCPQCGAQVVFSLGTTLLKVCEHCGTAVARKGADLANYGRVANVLPTPSVLALGLEGRYTGAPAFRLVGRLQLDYGAGTWDEWLMGFEADSWAWLSESQGKFHYMGQVPLPPLPEFSQLRVGQTVDTGQAGVFVVTEVRQARFMTAAGELPFDTQPGSLLGYADLSGPGGQFGTIDYGAGSTPEALYIGREVTLSEMGLKPVADEDRRAKATAANLSCPQCAGPIEVRAPDQAQRVACPWCGSLLDATRDFAVLEALDRVSVKPVIPLGTKGRLQGVEWQVIGFLERSVTVEGTRYPWQEYLLYDARKGFRWLVEANGHWSFVEPLNAGDVRRAAGGGVSYKGQAFQHFQSGMARVDHVLGEFYWAVAHGDTAETADYISPPHMLSREKTAEEISWSRGTYLEPADVAQAFRLKTLPERKGVGPHQLWPWKAQAWTVYGAGMGLASLVFFAFLALTVLGGRRVHTESVTIPQGTVPGTPEAAYYTQPFDVPSQRNMAISVQAPVSNTWLYLSGALINEETGGVDEFDAEVSYYFGSDSDGAWTEGSQGATSYVSSVPPGRYVLRLEPQWEAGKPPPSYQVEVRSGVARFYQAFLAMLAVGLWPLIVAWRHFRFEMQRWAESDHPWMSEGE